MRGDGVVTRLDTLPVNYVYRVLEIAEEFGYDGSLTLSEMGVGHALESGGSVDVPIETYYRIVEKTLAVVDIPAFGIRVGQKFSLADYGVLGYACISSTTLRQLLQTFFRFQQIVGSSATFSEALRVDGDQAMIEIRSSGANEHLVRFDIEEAMGQWSSAAKDILGRDDSMYTRVNLSCSKPAYAREMQLLLGCPVAFSQPRNEMVFPAAYLDLPLTMANELTSQLCEQQCNTILRGLTEQEGIVDQVRKIIINLPGQVPTPEEVASQLNMSYRTLRRRLGEEGTSFKEIHGEVRMGMAAEYIRQTELTTQEIAYLLGYGETSNFHRAFKTWYGQTPGEFRTDAQTQSD